jgi:hypothetical protein
MKALDKPITLARRRGLRATRRTSVWRRLCLSLVLGLAITTLNTSNSNALSLTVTQETYVMMAMNHLKSVDEGACWVRLIWLESRFNPLARNGSHYGLAQMRNVKVKGMEVSKQIDWHIRYLKHRYSDANGKPSACKALKHFNRKGWH